MKNIFQMKTRQQLEDELKRQEQINYAVIENSKRTWVAIQTLRENINKFDLEILRILKESNDLFEKLPK